MSNKLDDKIETRIEVTKAEMLNLLSQQAQNAGLIDYVPEGVEIDRHRWNPGTGDEEGWLLTFSKVRVV